MRIMVELTKNEKIVLDYIKKPKKTIKINFKPYQNDLFIMMQFLSDDLKLSYPKIKSIIRILEVGGFIKTIKIWGNKYIILK